MSEENGTAGFDPGNAGDAAGATGAGSAADEAKIASIVEKHGGDVNKIAAELAGFHASHGKSTQTISDLKKELAGHKGGKSSEADSELIQSMKDGLKISVDFAKDRVGEEFVAQKSKEPHWHIIAADLSKICKEDPEVRSMLERLEKTSNPIQAAKYQRQIWDYAYVKAMESNMPKIVAAHTSGKLPVSERSNTTSRAGGGEDQHPIKKLLKNYSEEMSEVGI